MTKDFVKTSATLATLQRGAQVQVTEVKSNRCRIVHPHQGWVTIVTDGGYQILSPPSPADMAYAQQIAMAQHAGMVHAQAQITQVAQAQQMQHMQMMQMAQAQQRPVMMTPAGPQQVPVTQPGYGQAQVFYPPVYQ